MMTQTLMIAPTRYLSGWGVLSELGELIHPTAQHATIIRGATGYNPIEAQVHHILDSLPLTYSELIHTGPCTYQAVSAIAERASGVIVGIGGGRVLDVAKGVANLLNLPYITVPTSPATCSAVTPLSVYYTDAGAYLESRALKAPPAATLVDLAIISAVPNRLLAAGIVDALAKYHEVRFAIEHNQASSLTAHSALALCQHLKDLIDQHAVDALTLHTPSRSLMAEAAILLPGLIGGLGGEVNKLAAAHAIHNALTQLPDSKLSLHGERVGFGILVQLQLTGAGVQEITATVRLMRQLQLPCTLEELGCADFYRDDQTILNKALAFPAMRRLFPHLTVSALREAMDDVERLVSCLT